jgi:putative restriction endonuclease
MEDRIRLRAFQWLKDQEAIYGDILPRKLLEQGFDFGGERITLIGPSGIWKPKGFSQIPISITTTYNSPYEDAFTKEDLLNYRYRGTDRLHRDNIGLREALARQVPLIYFHGVAPGKYLAVWPVYIIQDHPESLSFTVATDEVSSIGHHLDPKVQPQNGLQPQTQTPMLLSDNYEQARRVYLTSIVKYRVHQRSFRERVLQAYKEQCAFCRLKHALLLDAAHIIADREDLGEPLVINGLSLCKIHHAAFDANIIGVTPDFHIRIRDDILRETDGPMLKHGIQALENQKIILPGSRQQWPDRDRLSIRYDSFLNAV